jgi:uracil-DNA glycosylase
MNRQGLLNIVGKDWFDILHKVLTSEVEFQIDGARAQYNRTDIKVYPDPQDVWRAFVECPLDKLKVIILGQDVYPNGEGTGLCFEVKTGYKLTPSFIQLSDAYNEMYPSNFNTDIMDGKLGCWANQGVLLLNSSLTVEHGKPNSHFHLWEPFTKRFIKLIKEFDETIVIVTIGKTASDIVDITFDNVIRLEHPAYAARQDRKWKHNYFLCQVNDLLKQQNKQEIEW